MRKFLMVALVLTVLIGSAFSVAAQDQTIADIVVASASGDAPEFATLLAAVSAADPAVLAALSDPEAELTVFAPTDAAFAALAEALGEEAFAGILADQEALTGILLFHVVAGKVGSADVVAALEASVEGEEEGTLGAFSVPSLNGQYIDIAQDEMGGITVDGAHLNLEMVDIEASNGVIHVIDAVIVPESQTIAEIVTAVAGMEEGAEFTTLLAAVAAADPAVLETLSDPEAELTVFAPTDAAFAALGDETIAAVLADQATLTSILLYHVVPGVVRSGDLGTLLEEHMAMSDEALAVDSALEGAALNFSVNEDGNVVINDTVVIIATDIDAGNGVIHVIDAVLLPPTE